MNSSEFQGNPESGIDRFLNESNGIELPSDRDESLRPTPEVIDGARQELGQPSYQEALDKIKDLEHTLQGALSGREYWEDLANNRAGTIVKARNLIQDILAGDIDAKQTFEDFKEPFELLGVEVTRTIEIEVSVTWRGNIELPLGVEVDDLDIDDFDIDFRGHNEYEGDMNTWYEDYSITER